MGDSNNNSNICKGCQTSKYKCKACDWFLKIRNNVLCEGINVNGCKELI